MGSSEPLDVAPLALADLPDCLALSTAAGWNQVAADWRIFFDLGRVWGIRKDNKVVATAALLPYPPSTAWVSMVLTAKPAQGQGYASRLVAAALSHCEDKGLAPQLDATAAGEGVYARLGFRTFRVIRRWRRPPSGDASDPSKTAQSAISAIKNLDQAAIGFARPALLKALSCRGPTSVTETGFALSREGRTARQIGPLVAPTRQEAKALMAPILARCGAGSALIVDASDEAEAFKDLLRDLDFRPERAFARMAKGTPPLPQTALYLASAGPELG